MQEPEPTGEFCLVFLSGGRLVDEATRDLLYQHLRVGARQTIDDNGRPSNVFVDWQRSNGVGFHLRTRTHLDEERVRRHLRCALDGWRLPGGADLAFILCKDADAAFFGGPLPRNP